MQLSLPTMRAISVGKIAIRILLAIASNPERWRKLALKMLFLNTH
jgi:hypothetical protein